MPRKLLKEQFFGILPKPHSVESILQLKPNSKELIKVYDTRPNLVALLNSAEGKIVLKRFGWRSQFHFFISPFMHSRARMSWNTAVILDEFGITPKPLYVHTKKKLGLKFENFFITRAIHPHVNFRKFIKNETDTNKIKTAIYNLAIALAKMHSTGIYHRDLTTGNFLIDEKLNIFIVDLNRSKILQELSIRQRIRDIAKIHFPKSGTISQNSLVEIFFEGYTQNSGRELDWKNQYWKYRNKLIKSRNLSKNIKRYFRSNRSTPQV